MVERRRAREEQMEKNTLTAARLAVEEATDKGVETAADSWL